MTDAVPRPEPPASPVPAGDPAAERVAAARGAWAGVLVVAYAALVSVANGALLAVVLPVRSVLEWTALDVERRAHDQGGVEGVVDVGNVVQGAWAAVEAPLLYTGLAGTLLALLALGLGLGVVLGREWARVAARAALALRVVHELVAATWSGVAVFPDLRTRTEAVFEALRAAAQEAGQWGSVGDPPGILTGGGLAWASLVGAALHVLVLIWLFRVLGRPHVRDWCARRSANRAGASSDAPAASPG